MSSSIARQSWRTAVSLDEAQVLDAICDEFESEWQSSRNPSIEEYLTQAEAPVRMPLLAELINVDICYRRQFGEATQPQDYFTRFPELKEFLRSTAGDHLTLRDDDAKATALPATEPLPIDGEKIGEHQLLDVLGEGSFGSVWRAWNPKLERLDAIKLPRDRSQSRKQLDTFLHEARAAARLNHRNIVKVHGYGEHEQRGYIVFEFIAGTTLSQLRKTQPLDVRRSAEICRQLADALAHAHDNDIIHRDIKSSNVMMDVHGVPRLTDFGLARRMDVKSTIAHGGAIMGTIPYMSPEQLEGKRKVDASSDIYSLGIILYELLTGSVPFSGERSSLIAEILTKNPPATRLVNKQVPKDLETVCLKAIAKQKSDRYATAAEFRDDLQRFLNGEPVTARRLSLPTRAWRYTRRNPVLAGGYAGAIVFAGVAFGVVMNRNPPVPQDILDAAHESIRLSTVPDPTGQWDVNVLTTPPGAEIHVFPLDPNTGERRMDQGIRLDGVSPANVTLKPGRYFVTALLPGTNRFHEVERRVPNSKQTYPVQKIGDTEIPWRRLSDGTLEWLPIEIPPESVTDEMVLIKGTDKFESGDPDDPEFQTSTGPVADFYVSKTEFTLEDYFGIRPGRRGKANRAKPGEAYPQPHLERAGDWAEYAGGRLPTDIEFEYMAKQIQVPDNPLDFPEVGPLRHRPWDYLTSAPQVKGLMTGLAEWVGTFPSADLDAVAITDPASHGVIRGIPLDVTVEEISLGAISTEPSARQVVRRKNLPGVGFRIVRSAHPVTCD